MRLADTHVHLHAYEDVPGLLTRARAAGVELVVGVSVDLATAEHTIRLAAENAGVITAAGLHPAWLDETFGPASVDHLARLVQDHQVQLIGEIGLDSADAQLPIAHQLAAFEQILHLAIRLDRAVILHLQGPGTHDLALEQLRRIGLPRPGGVVHYFVGDWDLATRLLDAGLSISVGKPVTRLENAELRAAVQRVPRDRLLVETDSYPLPGRQTEPADVRLVVESVAELVHLPAEQLAEITFANLQRLLAVPGRQREL